jgi:Flp pilus assembly pilin Flp
VCGLSVAAAHACIGHAEPLVRRQTFFSNSFSQRKTNMRKLFKNKKGQGLVEYGILVGGIALVALAATAILGHKTTDLIGTVAGALPGAHDEDNGAIVSGSLVAVTTAGQSGFVLDASEGGSFSENLGINADGLIVGPAGHDHD